jgi:LysM repeat protein
MQKDYQESDVNIDDYSYYSSSNEEINKKSNSKKLLIPIFIGLLLVGYIFMDNQNEESVEDKIEQKPLNIEKSIQFKIREEIPKEAKDDLEKITNNIILKINQNQKERIETKKLSSKEEEKSITKVSETIEQNKTILSVVVTDDSLNRDSSEMRIVIVQKGDTLAKIAYRVYGNKADYIKILEANSEFIKNPRQIAIGQKLRIPE